MARGEAGGQRSTQPALTHVTHVGGCWAVQWAAELGACDASGPQILRTLNPEP